MHMIKYVSFFVLTLPFIINSGAAFSWGGEANTTNCLGTITLHTGEKIDVDHIKFGTKSSLDLYSMPKQSSKTPTIIDGYTEIELDSDPGDSSNTINITQIKIIKVPNPKTVYTYKKTDKGTPYKYLEVEIDGQQALAKKEIKIQATQSGKNTHREVKLRAMKDFTMRECSITPLTQQN